MVTEEELKNMSPQEIEDLQKKNCIFCQIISGKVPSKKVYEDEKALVILDINPASPGHLLILPKEHYVIMPQMPEDLVSHLFSLAKRMSGALLKALIAKGSNIFIANGAVAGQKAPHFMIHVIPRTEGDKLSFLMPKVDISKEAIDEVGKKLAIGLLGKQEVKEEIDIDSLKEVLDKNVV